MFRLQVRCTLNGVKGPSVSRSNGQDEEGNLAWIWIWIWWGESEYMLWPLGGLHERDGRLGRVTPRSPC